MELKAPVGMGTCGGIYVTIGIIGVKVAIGTEVTVSIPLGLKGSFDPSAAGRAPKAADGGCFLGMLCWETDAGAMEDACCNHSIAPLSCSLIAAVASPEGSVVSVGGGGRTGIESGV